MPETEYLTPEEIANILKVHARTVRNWLVTGELKGIHLKRLWRIPKSEFEKFIQNNSGTKTSTQQKIEP